MGPEKISVLHVISDTNFGGAGQYLLTLLAEPDYRARVDAHIACPSPGMLWDRLCETDARLFALSGGDRSLSAGQLTPLFSVISRGRFDVVHTHASLTARIVARLFPRLKIVFTKHTSGRTGKMASALQRLLADRIICPSKAVLDEMRATALPSSMLDLVYNGVDVDLISQRVQNSRSKDSALGSPLILSAGRLEPEKGHEWLIRAMPAVLEKHPDARLRILGDGSLLQHLQTVCADVAASPYVEFPGFVHDIPSALGEASLFVLPSLEETLGISVLEAMAAGLPIVASRTGGVPELIQTEHDGLLVDPGDAGQLSGAILRLLDKPEQAEEFARNAYQRVREQFSAKAQALGTVGVYEKLLLGQNKRKAKR